MTPKEREAAEIVVSVTFIVLALVCLGAWGWAIYEFVKVTTVK